MLGGKHLSKIEEKIEQLLADIIYNLGYDLYDTEYVKEGKDYFLRIYIDKDGGIDLNDCEKVNNAISDILDTADYINESYFLEVSSPGIERIIRKDKHFKDNIGNKIQLKLYKPIYGKKEIEGLLKDFNEEFIEIEIDGNLEKIDKKLISVIKTVFDW